MSEEINKLLRSLGSHFRQATLATGGQTPELTVDIGRNHSAVVRLYEGFEDSHYELNLLLRLDNSSYIYIASEVHLSKLKEEFCNLESIIKKFEKDEYRIDHEKIWRFWKKSYMVFSVNGEEIGLLQTK